MRVTITHPFCWPYVRRGAERYMVDLARTLTSFGHDVTTISSKPGPSLTNSSPDTGVRMLRRHLWHPSLSKVRLKNTDPFVLSSFWPHLRAKADVVHCLYHTDPVSALWARPFTKHKIIMQLVGPCYPQMFRRIPPERRAFANMLQRVDKVLTISQYCREMLLAHYGLDTEVISIPVNTDHFTPMEGEKTGPPRILSMASFKDRRKGARNLVRAFPFVKEACPDAILQLSGEMTEELKAELETLLPPHVLKDVEVLGVGSLEDVPRLYREATVTCLPSMHEAFGMVVLESWASGTPVVVTRHGAFPELLGEQPECGVMFDPMSDGMEAQNPEGLAAALVEGLRLAKRPGISEQCRQRALQMSWQSLGPAYDDLVRRVAGK